MRVAQAVARKWVNLQNTEEVPVQIIYDEETKNISARVNDFTSRGFTLNPAMVNGLLRHGWVISLSFKLRNRYDISAVEMRKALTELQLVDELDDD